MGVTIKKASEFASEGPSRRFVLLFGDTGTGKTTCGAMAPRPLIILTEPNGKPSILAANPEADIIEVTTIQEVADAFALYRQMHDEGNAPWDTVVLDSLTEAQSFIRHDTMKRDGKIDAAGREAEPPSMRVWGTIIERTEALVRAFRALPGCHRLAICLLEKTTAEGDKDEAAVVHLAPQMYGKKLPNRVASLADLVGCTFRTRRDGAHRVLFRGPETYLVKGHANLGAIEGPQLAEWMRKMDSPVPRAAFASDYAGVHGVPQIDAESAQPENTTTEETGAE